MTPIIMINLVQLCYVLAIYLFPLMFFNDIGDNSNSTIKLFADDCLLFRTIKSMDDTVQLQKDLNELDKLVASMADEF